VARTSSLDRVHQRADRFLISGLQGSRPDAKYVAELKRRREAVASQANLEAQINEKFGIGSTKLPSFTVLPVLFDEALPLGSDRGVIVGLQVDTMTLPVQEPL
jgi:hypothetical protein